MSFDQALAILLPLEGGWYPGTSAHDRNPTMKGITQATYNTYRDQQRQPRQSVRHVTDAEVRAIYEDYWKKVKADQFGPLTAASLFDHAVNAGPSRAVQLLQYAVGTTPDGQVGPRTLAAARQFSDQELALRYSLERVQHYLDIVARNRDKLPALRSWLNRVLVHQRRAFTPLDRSGGVFASLESSPDPNSGDPLDPRLG